MKNFFLLFVIFSAQSILGQIYNPTKNNEKNVFNLTDENNGFLKDIMIRMHWQDNSWMNSMMWENNYDESNKIQDTFIYSFILDEWLPKTHVSRTYNERGNNIEYLEESWQDSIWINKRRYVKNYDDNDNLIYFEYQIWKDSSWHILNRNNIILDENNYRSEELSEKWEDSNWVNYSMKYYSYTDEFLTENVFALWNDSTWENISRSSYIYDENDLLTLETYEIWEEGAWKNNMRVIYTYNENQNLINSLEEKWIDENWNKYEYQTYVYDTNNNNTEITYQRWEDSIWINITKDILTYIPITSIAFETNLITGFELHNNYPNPFNPTTKIEYSIPRQSNITLKVFDVLGSEVAIFVNKEQNQGNYELDFDGSDLTSGIYFYKLQAGDFVETKKMILLK